MKVIFDFDDVIFNSKGFKESLFRQLKDNGYDDVQDKYEAFRLTKIPFSLKAFLSNQVGITSQDLIDEVYEATMIRCPALVNSEVLALMKTVGSANYIIITNGDHEFQMAKIRKSLGKELALHVVVVPGSKAESIKDYCKRHQSEQIIFVDDKQHFIDDLFFGECPNLRTVLFDSDGLKNLRKEISEAKEREHIKEIGEVVEHVGRPLFKINDGGSTISMRP